MPKRGNDNAQVSKEEYDDEAEEVVGDDGRPLGTSGFARADAGQLQKRRIIKAGRKFRQAQPTNGGANGGATPAPVARAAAAPAAAAAPGGNPFGGIALAATAPAPTPAAGGGSNPFAQVNLLGAASATPAPAVPGAFKFGAASNVPKVQPAPKLFPTKAAAPAAAAPSAPAASKKSNGKIPEYAKLNVDYLTHCKAELEANPSSDLSQACIEYHEKAAEIEQQMMGRIGGGDQDSGDEEKKAEDNGSGASAPVAPAAPAGGFSFGASTSAPAPAPAPAAPAPAGGFSFGASSSSSTNAPAPAPAFGFGAANSSGASASAPASAPAAGGFGGFSFASTPAPAPDSAAAKAATTAFSFGNPVAAPVPAPAPAPAAAEEDDDGNGGFAKEAPAEVQREENKEEDVVFECRAQYFKQEVIDPEEAPGTKGWKKYATGALRLQRHKENGKCRMLMRDSIGKAMLNLSVTRGMEFNGELGTGKTAGKANVKFLSAKNEKEMDLYMIRCKSVHYEKLLAKLQEMAKSAPAK